MLCIYYVVVLLFLLVDFLFYVLFVCLFVYLFICGFCSFICEPEKKAKEKIVTHIVFCYNCKTLDCSSNLYRFYSF